MEEINGDPNRKVSDQVEKTVTKEVEAWRRQREEAAEQAAKFRRREDAIETAARIAKRPIVIIAAIAIGVAALSAIVVSSSIDNQRALDQKEQANSPVAIANRAFEDCNNAQWTWVESTTNNGQGRIEIVFFPEYQYFHPGTCLSDPLGFENDDVQDAVSRVVNGGEASVTIASSWGQATFGSDYKWEFQVSP